MEYDCELESWFVVQLVNKDGEVVSEVLWGIISLDKKGRFPKGHYVNTSEILQKFNDEYIRTLNSTYKLQKHSGETIKLPRTIFTLLALKNGYSPLLIKKSHF